MELLLNLALIDIPEAFVIVMAGLAVYNLSIRPRLKSAVLISCVYGIGSFLLTYYDVPYLWKVLTLYVFMNLLIARFMKTKVGLTVGITTSAFVFLTVAEFFVITLFNAFSITIEQILQNPLYLYSGVWLYLLLLLLLIAVLRTFQFDLRKLFPKTKSNRSLFFLVLLGSVEFLLIVLMNTSSILLSDYQQFVTKQQPIIHMLILVFFVAIVILFRIYLTLTIHRVEAETETPYIKNINDMVTAIRSIKHDVVNHYTAINGFLKVGMTELASDYVKQLLSETTELIKVVEGVKNPAVSALIHSKMAVCVADRIPFTIDIRTDSQCSFMKTSDLITVLGNLLDNAIRATSFEEEANRYIKVEWAQAEGEEYIVIENSGPTIPAQKLQQIFRLGYTTKPDGQGGVGLAVVKKVVEKYHGKVAASSHEGVTRFRMSFPQK